MGKGKKLAVLLLAAAVASGSVLPAAADGEKTRYQEGSYTLTTDKGGSREPVQEDAPLTVDADGGMSLTLLIKNTMTGIKKDGEALSAGEPVVIGGTEYFPVTLSLANKNSVQGCMLNIQMGASARDVAYNLTFNDSRYFVTAGTTKTVNVTATTSRGASDNVYSLAEVTTGDSYTAVLYASELIKKITFNGAEYLPGEPVEKEGKTWYPFTVNLGSQASVYTMSFTVLMGTTERPANYTIEFSDDSIFPTASGTASVGVTAASASSGSVSTNVYPTATLNAGDTYAVTLLVTQAINHITYNGSTCMPDRSAGQVIGGTTYIPYTVPLTERTDSLALTSYVAAMGRDVSFSVGLSGWDTVPAVEEEPEAPAWDTMQVTSDRTYFDAEGDIREKDGAYEVTVYSKYRLSYNGTEIAADGTKEAKGEMLPYTFVLADRNAEQTVNAIIRMGAMGDRPVEAKLTFANEKYFPTQQEPEEPEDSRDDLKVTAMSKGRDGQMGTADYIGTEGKISEKDGAYEVTVYSKYRLSYNGTEIEADASLPEKDGMLPYTFVLADKKAEQTVNAIIRMGAMGDVPVEVKLTLENEKYFKAEEEPEPTVTPSPTPTPTPAPEPETPAVASGSYKIQVSNASSSSYGKTVVYPEAELVIGQNDNCTITVYLKESITNIRTESGSPVAAGGAKSLTMNGETANYYPYTFTVKLRQGQLKIMDDVPAMSNVASMNYGRDMTTTINIDWNTLKAGEGVSGGAPIPADVISKLADGEYTVPVSFQSASSVISLDPKAAVNVSGSAYKVNLLFPAGTVSAAEAGGKPAEMHRCGDRDSFGFIIDKEESQIPVQLSVVKMAGTAMEKQSFVVIPDWTKAEKTGHIMDSGTVRDGVSLEGKLAAEYVCIMCGHTENRELAYDDVLQVQEGVPVIPAGLVKAGINSENRLKKAFEDAAKEKMPEPDGSAMYSVGFADGLTAEGNGKYPVVLPWPDGVKKGECELLVTAMTADGKAVVLDYTETDDGIQIFMDELLPVSVFWKAEEEEAVETVTIEEDGAAGVVEEETEEAAPAETEPKKAGVHPAAVAVPVAVAAAACIAGVVVYRKKKNAKEEQ